jgi:Kef-type K+ transport system membrane component KefB
MKSVFYFIIIYYLFYFLKKIVGGIFLGPSVFGNIPGWTQTIFPTTDSLTTISNIGLVMNMFLIGMEVDLENMRQNFKRSAIISFSGICLPLILSIGTSKALYIVLQDDKSVPFANFCMFIGAAMSITVGLKVGDVF